MRAARISGGHSSDRATLRPEAHGLGRATERAIHLIHERPTPRFKPAIETAHDLVGTQTCSLCAQHSYTGLQNHSRQNVHWAHRQECLCSDETATMKT
jgi:hypothetical protein